MRKTARAYTDRQNFENISECPNPPEFSQLHTLTKLMRSILLLFVVCSTAFAEKHPEFSGIYPHLAFFNNENECGTGAVVPWADRLWAVTYAPHMPKGSSDKLYEIDGDLNMTVRKESIGGTPANRMIHRESEQLFIGPYAIDADRKVRAIPYTTMYGRPTGNARHLTDPANKIYYATMEEGFYEVDVRSLAVTTLFHDEQLKEKQPKANLPGYHGKGLYSGHGQLIYSNNGEHGKAARINPFVDSGVLASWDGKAEQFEIIRRNQFTEVTGPGGIYGSENPATDAVWALGWDAKSLLLVCLFEGQWHRYRLPKASHSYDGAHGWNTEWPRIREIGDGDNFLMTMHGMFWKFPKTFTPKSSAGITPRSTYLKVVGDFCRWGDHVVLGCDDTAKSEFLNKRKAKGEVAAPQSQSNLWFVKPEQLDHFGPVIGRGAVWLNEKVEAGKPSDAFAFRSFEQRAIHLHSSSKTKITFEIDITGNGTWTPLSSHEVEGYWWHAFDQSAPGTWIRLTSSNTLAKATAWFTYGKDSIRTASNKFTGLSKADSAETTGGIVRARDKNKRTLQFASDAGYYELSGDAVLRKVDAPDTYAWLKQNAAVPDRAGVLEIDDASVLYIDDTGKRWRLPKGSAALDDHLGRICREVATERDLFNAGGTFYELPAENAGGFAKVRPVTTHNLRLDDYCSYRGLLILSGIDKDAPASNHIVRSDDGKTALWLGVVDDLWALGKPVGTGGPWKNTSTKAGTPSDPYLMTGYDQKTLTLSTSSRAKITAKIDITGMGDWYTYKTFDVEEAIEHQFPQAFQAYWIRFISDTETTASAQLTYR